jgi:tripartite-type tricarboxylate transporter receptor subunit TctC
VTSAKRVETMPDVPTIAESGVPGYEVAPWYGVFTTGGTPMPTVKRLAQEIAAVVATPSVRNSISKQGIEPSALGPGGIHATREPGFPEMGQGCEARWDQVGLIFDLQCPW